MLFRCLRLRTLRLALMWFKTSDMNAAASSIATYSLLDRFLLLLARLLHPPPQLTRYLIAPCFYLPVVMYLLRYLLRHLDRFGPTSDLFTTNFCIYLIVSCSYLHCPAYSCLLTPLPTLASGSYQTNVGLALYLLWRLHRIRTAYTGLVHSYLLGVRIVLNDDASGSNQGLDFKKFEVWGGGISFSRP